MKRGTVGPAIRRAAGVFVAIAAVAGLVALLYCISFHLYAGDSDKATALIEGQSLRNGNLLLHGWYLPLDSYWTVDAPPFALLVLVSGVHPQLFALEPALMAAGVIVAGVFMVRAATTRTAARTAATIAGGASVVVLLALPTFTLGYYFLADGFHVGTVLWALIAFALLCDGRFGWRFALGLLVLTAGILGDLSLFPYAVAPSVLAGLLAMARRRSWRAGASLVAAGAGSVALAEVVRRVVVALGAFTTGPALPFAHTAQMLRNFRQTFTWLAGLLGLRKGLGTGGAPAALADVHVVGGLVLLAAFVVAVVRLVGGVVTANRRLTPGGGAGGEDGGDWCLDDLLVLAALGVAATFVATSLSSDPSDIRYLDGSVIFMVVLAGRMVARAVQAAARAGGGVRAGLRTAAALGVAVALAYGAAAGYLIAQPAPVAPQRALAGWLAAHDLHDGLASYWAASITTVESGGAVTVRPITAAPDGRLGRMLDQSYASWYEGQQFRFVVTTPNGYGGVNPLSAIATFGPPAHSYDVNGYQVLVWSHPLTVAAFPGVSP